MKSLVLFSLLALSILVFPSAAHAASWEMYEPGPVTEEDAMLEAEGPEEIKVLSLDELPRLPGTSARTNGSSHGAVSAPGFGK